MLQSLRRDGIHIMAIHSLTTEASRRLTFLHYWGRGKAVDPARASIEALDPVST